jgi:UDP-N-acetylmuramoyl-L-alanyl-D-glutamate--2,6-diaminopimelate ligase
MFVTTACGCWNECQPADLYVAISDADSDGHEYAAEAIRRGAAAVVAERYLPVAQPQFIVQDSRVAYARICQALAGSPSQRLVTVGVSGSVGKTVTSHLIQSIFAQAGYNTGVSSSIVEGQDADPMLPLISPPRVAERLAQMVMRDCSHAVLEAPSVGLARHAYCGLTLDAAVWTNIAGSHLNLHGNLENYRRATARLADHLKSAGFAVLNADDQNSVRLLKNLAVPALTFGIHNRADISAKLLDRNACFQTFVIAAGEEAVAVRTKMIGKQHVYNCLAAAATALGFGMSLESIAAGLGATMLAGRLERVDCGQDFGVWIDNAATPLQLAGAIASLTAICKGKLWCVCSIEATQSAADRRRLGEILSRRTDQAVITHSHDQATADYEPCHQLLDGFENPAAARTIPNRKAAIEWVLSTAQANDVVLIAGRGERRPKTETSHQGSISANMRTDREICQAVLTGDLSDDEPAILRLDDYR